MLASGGAAGGGASKPPSAWRQSYAISCTACGEVERSEIRARSGMLSALRGSGTRLRCACRKRSEPNRKADALVAARVCRAGYESATSAVRQRGRAEVARRHGGGAQVKVMPSSASSSVSTMRASWPARRCRAAGALAMVSSLAQHVGPARLAPAPGRQKPITFRARAVAAHIARRGWSGSIQNGCESMLSAHWRISRLSAKMLALSVARPASPAGASQLLFHCCAVHLKNVVAEVHNSCRQASLHPMLNVAIKAARACRHHHQPRRDWMWTS